MEDSAHHLEQNVLPAVPIRQWVLSPPSELCGLLAARGAVLSKMATFFVRAIAQHQKSWAKEELGLSGVHTGAVVVIQRFSNTLAIYPHLHVLVLDGVFEDVGSHRPLHFHPSRPPDALTMLRVGRDFFARFEACLERQGYMEERDMEETDDDAWFVRGTKEPSWIERPAPPAAQRTSPTSVVDRQEVGSAGEPGMAIAGGSEGSRFMRA